MNNADDFLSKWEGTIPASITSSLKRGATTFKSGKLPLNKNAKNFRYCRTLWISDVHLGTKDCKDALLDSFLKAHRPEQVYIVGDFIDGWRMKSGVYWTRGFTRIIRRILKLSKDGVPVYYITGNHDEFLRKFANNRFDNIHILNRKTHITADNKKLLVLHGDQFDGVATCHKFLHRIGDISYCILMFINRLFNHLREKYGHGYWSLAGFLKSRIKRARKYINEYEQGAAWMAKHQGFDGIVCGHIHQAANKMIDDVHYFNTGDWVESCTALVEDFDGSIELIHWRESRKKLDLTEPNQIRQESELSLDNAA